MKAEEYATKNAKTPEEVFNLYHAFKAGEIAGENSKFQWGSFIIGVIGVLFIGMMLAKTFPSLIK